MPTIKKEIYMFQFTKALDTPEDLTEWKIHFLGKGIYTEIKKKEEGGYELWREGLPSKSTFHPIEPVSGPCIFCGSVKHIGVGNRFKYCSDECMSIDLRVKHFKYTKGGNNG